MFAAIWLACVGVLILKNRGLPSWLGWLAFPAAAVSGAPSLAIVGVNSPVDVVVATTSMLLWIAAVAVVLLARAIRSRRAETETVHA
jgi:hypothetical protein